WISAGFGALIILAALSSLSSGVREAFAMVLVGLAIGLPGAWWLYCERRDAKFRAEAADREQTYSLLTDADRSLLGEPAPAEHIDRRWNRIRVAAIAFLIAGLIAQPSQGSTTSETEDPAPS
ncbi:TPA: hypothetical protein ACKJ9L_002192, partial [Neisseria gonorrhoeae]